MSYLPSKYALVKGSGEGDNALTAFDRALIQAGVGNFNLSKVTSILPAGGSLGDITSITQGSVVYAAMASKSSEVEGELIAAAVAAGVPDDDRKVGVLMEGSFSCSAAEAEERVREMARQALMDRDTPIRRIESVAAELRVTRLGSVFAAVLLW